MTPSVNRKIIYPDSDGQPMADNTKQFRWIVLIKENLELLFADQPNVFVAGDLLWYPVEGHPEIRVAPDAMVVFGRPKGDRGSYRQWEEDNIAPQVVFEILSPGNRVKEMTRKLQFYDRYGLSSPLIKIQWIQEVVIQWIKITFHHSLFPHSRMGDRPWLRLTLAVSLPIKLVRLGFSPFSFGLRLIITYTEKQNLDVQGHKRLKPLFAIHPSVSNRWLSDWFCVEEYYIYDPDDNELAGLQRLERQLQPIEEINHWVSPRLGIKFVQTEETLEIYRPDGEKFLSSLELYQQRQQASKQAQKEAQRAEQEAQRAEQESQRAEKLAAQLRALGVDPDS